MTSHFEGLPMVLLEAMSQGLPLVSMDCPRGPAEIIEDGVNGRLVADGDLDGFRQALRQVMDDDDLRRRMGAAGLHKAEAHRVDAVADRWKQLFDELVREV
jgi:glycosyltransferase involved in cell wall biosynthesis